MAQDQEPRLLAKRGERRPVQQVVATVRAFDSLSVKSDVGPPMTLGNAAAAHVRLIVWCRDCCHQVEPDPAAQAQRYGADTPVLDWRERLVCSKCGSREIDMVATGTRR